MVLKEGGYLRYNLILKDIEDSVDPMTVDTVANLKVLTYPEGGKLVICFFSEAHATKLSVKCTSVRK